MLKIDWLLEHIGLHDLSDSPRGVPRSKTWPTPECSKECRQAIIDAVRAFRWPDEKDPDKERRGAVPSIGMAALAP